MFSLETGNKHKYKFRSRNLSLILSDTASLIQLDTAQLLNICSSI